MTEVTIRKAHVDDVKNIHALLMDCARKGQLLPRALIFLYGHIRNFHVAETPDGRLVACCALAPVWEDLAEVCSLVVDESMRRQGAQRAGIHARHGEAEADPPDQHPDGERPERRVGPDAVHQQG